MRGKVELLGIHAGKKVKFSCRFDMSDELRATVTEYKTDGPEVVIDDFKIDALPEIRTAVTCLMQALKITTETFLREHT